MARGNPYTEKQHLTQLYSAKSMYLSGNLYASGTSYFNTFETKNDVIFSGNLQVLGKVYDGNSNLILSSAIGSVIAASGVLEFPEDPTIGTAHIVANNSYLILSSAAGSVIALSAAQDIVNPNNKNYHIRAINSHLILSSSTGSNIVISGNLHFPVDAESTCGHITAKNSYLILSSSAGSTVAISGTLAFPNGPLPGQSHIVASGSNLILSASTSTVSISGNLQFESDAYSAKGHITAISNNLILSSSVGTVVVSSSLQVVTGSQGNIFIGPKAVGGIFLRNVGSVFEIRRGDNGGYSSVRALTTAVTYAGDAALVAEGTGGGARIGVQGRYTWSSNNDGNQGANDTAMARAAQGIVYISGALAGAGITAQSGHLILSSAVGSNIVISGTVGTQAWTVTTVSTGTFKAGQMAYVSDGAAGSPCLAVYNGTDWLRVALGTVIDGAA